PRSEPKSACRPNVEPVDPARCEAGVFGIGNSEVGADTAGESGSRTIVVGADTAACSPESSPAGVIGTGRLHGPPRSPHSSPAESDEELKPPARKPSVELCSASRSPAGGTDEEAGAATGEAGAIAGSGGSGSEGRGTDSGVCSLATPDSGNDPVRLEGPVRFEDALEAAAVTGAGAAGSTALCEPEL